MVVSKRLVWLGMLSLYMVVSACDSRTENPVREAPSPDAAEGPFDIGSEEPSDIGSGNPPADAGQSSILDGGGNEAEVPDMPSSYYADTIVSLTFDDGLASQWVTREILEEYHQKATYFIISGRVGAKSYLTREQIAMLEKDGHEIGGHTRTHPDTLTELPPEEAHAEICGGKEDLEEMGLNIRSFAYPFNRWNEPLQAVVADCNIESARRSSGISNHECDKCQRSESLPPRDQLAIRTVQSVSETNTLSSLQEYVYDAAASGGGWVTFVFHHVCEPSCGDYSISPSLLRDFVSWLSVKGLTVLRAKDVMNR